MKKILSSGLFVAVAASMLSLPVVHAQQPTGASAGFCAKITSLRADVDRKMGDRAMSLKDNRTERMEALKTRRAERDVKLKDNRETRRENMDDHFSRLAERADTDAKQQAVDAFKASMESARATRQGAVDAAIQAFHTGVDSILAEQQSTVDNAKETFESATRAALERARTACASANANGAQIRTALKTDLKAAKDGLRTTRTDLEKRKDAMKPLIETRRQAIDKANADFKATMEKAVADLKTAFGE